MPLVLQRQGLNECYPTAVCMLMGVSWAELKPRIEASLGKAWTETHGHERRLAGEILLQALGAPGNLIDVCQSAGNDLYFAHGRAPKLHVPRGTGLMIITERLRSGKRIGHVVAYDAGLIYDPEAEHPFAEEEFQRVYRGWRFNKNAPMQMPSPRMTPEENRVHDAPLPKFWGCR